MKDHNKHSFTVFGIAILLALASAGCFVGGVYLINAKADELATMNMTAAENDAFRTVSRTLNQELARTKAARAELETLLISGDDGLLTFLTELDLLAAAESVILSSGGLDTDSVGSDGLQHLTMTLVVRGGRANTLAFLQGLETLPYHAWIEDVVMTTSRESVPSKEANEGDTNLQLTLVVTAQNIEL